MVGDAMSHAPRLLGDLLPGVAADIAAVPVSGLTVDSRKVSPGMVFLAVKGHADDGRKYMDAAIRSGAVAVIADAPCDPARWRLPVLEVENLSRELSAIAGRFYDQPSRDLKLIGITGTNGKTSCAWSVAQMLETMGQPCGLIGTLGSGRYGHLESVGNTTPDAVAVQALLAQWRDGGAQWAAMEVSSHGLAQHRVAALHYEAAVFTNLSQDHLDYHGSMAAYGAEKARLTSWPELPLAVINRDDEFGRRLIAQSTATQVVDYSLRDSAAAVWAEDIHCDIHGSRATLNTPWGRLELVSSLLGEFNLSNLVASCSTLLAMGLPLVEVESALRHIEPVPGRMEWLRSDDNVLVVIDFAHTEDALKQALETLRPLAGDNAVHCVFGCGGDRDTGKRPGMGRVAAAIADRVTLTSDNPRSESPEKIIDDIAAGAVGEDAEVEIEPDRHLAIAAAVARAEPGDIVLIAGKGHEQTQEIGGQRFPFSDLDHAREAIRGRGAA